MNKHRYRKYQLWLSKEEDEALAKLCEKTALSRATVLRKFILSEPIKERPNADFKKLTDEINNIGINFNQLVHKVNTVGYATDEDVKEAQRAFELILKKLHSWEKTWR